MGQRLFALIALVCGLVLPTIAQAQAAVRALPSLHRVGVASQPRHNEFRLAGHLGYSGTESVLDQDDTHQRIHGGLGLGVVRRSGWSASLRVDGRHDRHDGTEGKDDSWVGDPRIAVRYTRDIGELWSVGVQAGVWLPGANAPSLEPGATTLDGRLLVGIAGSNRPYGFSLHLGGRYDRSGRSVESAEQLSAADWIALGVSDYSAVLAGLGAHRVWGATTLFGEWTWDLLVGSGAPSAGDSPMRISAGLRHGVGQDESVQLSAQAEILLSGRATIDVEGPLSPVEPRFSLLAGMVWSFGRPHASNEPASRKVIVFVTTPEGVPIPAAAVKLVGPQEQNGTTDRQGRVIFPQAPTGGFALAVEAPGYDSEQAWAGPDRRAPVQVKLRPALPPGQLGVAVRDLATGKPLKAAIVVQPEDGAPFESETEDDGVQELVLLPGAYRVTVSVDGYQSQTRSVRIEQDGVTLLNLDLRRKRP